MRFNSQKPSNPALQVMWEVLKLSPSPGTSGIGASGVVSSSMPGKGIGQRNLTGVAPAPLKITRFGDRVARK